MDQFTSDRVVEVEDAIKKHCLRPSDLLADGSEHHPAHLKWALPVLHVPFFSNTFVAAYLYAEALKRLLGSGSGTGQKTIGEAAWIRDLIVQQDWSREPLQIMNQFRFNMFFSDPDVTTPSIQHLVDHHIRRAACFSYSHTEAFTDSPVGFQEIMEPGDRPLMIVTDIPAEAAKVKAHAERINPSRQVTVVELGARSVGSVLCDTTEGLSTRLFFFGSPKTELFSKDNDLRPRKRQRHKIMLAEEMQLAPVKTDLAIHFKYSADAKDAEAFLEALATTVRKCIEATNSPDPSAQSAASYFFGEVVQQYNRLARSIAVGDQIPEGEQRVVQLGDRQQITEFYVKSIAKHATV